MVSATASDGRLRVRLGGSDAVWAFKRRLDVPLSAVSEVRLTEDLSPWLGWRNNELGGLRMPGTMVPGLIAAGSYWSRRKGWMFCCLRRNQRALVVDLEPGAGRYRRLVLGVEDADGALALIDSARPGDLSRVRRPAEDADDDPGPGGATTRPSGSDGHPSSRPVPPLIASADESGAGPPAGKVR
jgi:hypothetical protein